LEHADSESRALLSLLLKPNVTQFASDSFVVGIAVHNSVLYRRASSTIVPNEHHANFSSEAQNWPSLLAEVQKLDSIGIIMRIVLVAYKKRKILFSHGSRYACNFNEWFSIASRFMFKVAQLDAASASEN